MKKILSIVLAAAMVLAAGVVSFAAYTPSAGDLFEKDEDGRLTPYSDGGSLIPGKTYYIYVDDKDHKPKSKVKIDYEGINNENEKSVKFLTSTNLSVSKKKTDDGTYAYFAEMKMKTLPASSYEDGLYEMSLTAVEATDSSDGDISFTGDINPTAFFYIEYPSGYDITSELQFFEFDDETDVIDVDDRDASVEVDSEGVRTGMLISCDTSYDTSFGSSNLNANLRFYYFNDARARKPMTVKIATDGAKYIYEKTANGLKDITKIVGSDFEFRTIELGEYVTSDVALNASAPATPSNPATPSAPSGGNIPFNPGTGAAA